MDLLLDLVLAASQDSRDKSPLAHYLHEQVLILIKEASCLRVESDLGSAMFDAALNSFLVELICNLVEQGLLPLLHSVELEDFERLFDQGVLPKIAHCPLDYSLPFFLKAVGSKGLKDDVH